jgi:hypothetical protein
VPGWPEARLVTPLSACIERTVIHGDFHRTFHPGEVSLLEFLHVIPLDGWETTSTATLAVVNHSANRIVFKAPLSSLADRFLRLASLDDYFGARALWFLADDLSSRLSQPTVDKIDALRRAVTVLRAEWLIYARSVGGCFTPFSFPPSGTMRIYLDGAFRGPVTIEYGMVTYDYAEWHRRERDPLDEVDRLGALEARNTELSMALEGLRRQLVGLQVRVDSATAVHGDDPFLQGIFASDSDGFVGDE